MTQDAPDSRTCSEPDVASGRTRWRARDVRQRTFKPRDAWWTVLLVDPLAAPLTALVANRTRLSPNQVSVLAFIAGLGAAAAFWAHRWPWLVLGAVLYHLSFTLDCVDGKLARLTGHGSPFGALLDYLLDRIRVVVVTVGLFGGQYRATGHARYLYLGIIVVALDALRYLDAMQAAGVHRDIRSRLDTVRRNAAALLAGLDDVVSAGAANAMAVTDLVRRAEDVSEQAAAVAEPVAPADGGGAMHAEFNARLPFYPRLRRALARRRIRTQLVSGVEFQMGVFIIAPLADQVEVVTIVVAALLGVFELGVLARVAASARDGARLHDRLSAELVDLRIAVEALESADSPRSV